MKERKTRNCAKSILCVLLVVVMTFVCLPFEGSAATVRSKKVLSVVYDDSTSMADGSYKWCYANYAVQSLTALMNKEDSLYITYMHNSVSKEMDLQDKEATVKKIRDHSDALGTPFKAVENAFEKLKSHKDKNKNTQYWLVIMTDGDFGSHSALMVGNELCKYADTKMSNGTKPEIVFFSMCDANNMFTPQSGLRSNIDIKKADKADDIIDAVSAIADRVSGRYAAPDADITVVDEKTVKVTSKLPLRTIGVLSQRSTAKVKKADLNGTKGVIESNIMVKYPEPGGLNIAKDKSLKGNVALINNGADNIPAGTYTITFSGKITKENLKILFEPAFELRLELIKEGNVLTDTSKIPLDSVLTAKATLYEAGTNNVIDVSLLPGNVSTTVSHLESKKVVNTVQGDTLADVKISDKPTSFEAVFELQGFFYLYQSVSFTPVRLEVTGLTAELFYDGSKRYGDHGENVIYTHDLRKNKTGIKFFMEIDGVPATKDDAVAILSEFKAGTDTALGSISYEVGDDGSVLVYPTKSIFYPSALYWLKWHGIQRITESIDKVSAYGELEIMPGWDILLEIWGLWVLIRILLLKFRRKTFNNIKIKSYILDSVPPGTGDPFRDCAERTTVLKSVNRSFVYVLLLLVIPIPGLELLLLKAAKVKISGTDIYALATSRGKNSSQFKIVSSKDFEYRAGPVSRKHHLPPPPRVKEEKKAVLKRKKKDEEDDKNSYNASPGSTVVFCTRPNHYIKMKIESIQKQKRNKK